MDSDYPDEKFFIDKCKLCIENNLNLGSSQHWKHRDFEYLSEQIFEITKILISTSTLKRIWKKKHDSLFHTNTLNALAAFLNYQSWQDFKKQNSIIIQDHLKKKSSNIAYKKRLKFFVIPVVIFFLLAAISIIAYQFIGNTNQRNYENIVFNSKTVLASGVPNTVIFYYDISSVGDDSVYLQQSRNPRMRVKLDKNNHYYTCIYHYPTFHRAKLIINNEIIKEHYLTIKTDGWITFVEYELYQRSPFYLAKDDIIFNGTMTISPQTLSDYKINVYDKTYWVHFYNIGAIDGLDGDNFTLKTRIKNDVKHAGMICQYSTVMIWCEKTHHSITLSNPGCVSDGYTKFSETRLDGKTNDLSKFGCDLSNWNDLRCEVSDKVTKIFLNNNLIYDLNYNTPAGNVIGLQYIFFGCGSVDFVRLYDKNNQIVYNDDFDLK